jgi:hypothetical protein
MPEPVYRVLSLLCAVVAAVPVGTNLGLVYLVWMLVSGRLLQTRGAVIPGLSLAGLPDPVVRRAWAALGRGRWTIAALLTCWQGVVEGEGRWHPQAHAGYRPVAVDVTAFWRPRLRDCRTTHYDGRVGKALPAIPMGIVARVGSVGGQRLGVPLALVRADAADPSVAAHERVLVRAALAVSAAQDVLVLDAGFSVRRLQEAGATRYVVRQAKNVTARRATPPTYSGRGRRPTRGVVVRPVPRRYRGQPIAASSPDWVETWQEGAAVVRAEGWDDLVLPDAAVGAPTFRIVAIHDPRWTEPLVLASPLAVAARVLRDLYLDRWPVEQLPLAAKQMIGAARQFVSAPETCQRLPELALLAGSMLTYAAATQPAVPTGFWDRQPRPTPGRLRRVLGRATFPTDFPLPAQIRAKAAVTDHLPKGSWGQRAQPNAAPPPRARRGQPTPSGEAA